MLYMLPFLDVHALCRASLGGLNEPSSAAIANPVENGCVSFDKPVIPTETDASSCMC